MTLRHCAVPLLIDAIPVPLSICDARCNCRKFHPIKVNYEFANSNGNFTSADVVLFMPVNDWLSVKHHN